MTRSQLTQPRFSNVGLYGFIPGNNTLAYQFRAEWSLREELFGEQKRLI